MFDDAQGPIEHFSWGRYVICGEEHGKIQGAKVGRGKDIRLIGKKVSKWKERKGHLLSLSMITGVFDQGVEILIIGTGVNGFVECTGEVENSIRKRGIKEVVLKKTPEACRLYNSLYRNKEKVALLAHGTC
jgi:hypothetical protein